MNEQSKGNEGGRIVRKLIAELLESPLQRQISHHPQSYHEAATIEVICSCGVPAPAGTAAVPVVSFRIS
jgi:hypothetical protein